MPQRVKPHRPERRPGLMALPFALACPILTCSRPGFCRGGKMHGSCNYLAADALRNAVSWIPAE